MAEKVVIVCDVCGAPAIESAKISTSSRNVVKDVCSVHLAELLAGTHAPRRGRPRTRASAASRPAASPAATPAAPKRRGRPPKAATEAPAPKRERRRITDPVILEKRRAALAKARQVRAANRAAAKASG